MWDLQIATWTLVMFYYSLLMEGIDMKQQPAKINLKGKSVPAAKLGSELSRAKVLGKCQPLQSPAVMNAVQTSDECRKKMEGYAKKRDLQRAREFAYALSEERAGDPEIYDLALDLAIKKRDWESVEDVAQSISRARVQGGNLLVKAVDALLSPVTYSVEQDVSMQMLQVARLRSACLIFGWLFTVNKTSKPKDRVDASAAFELAIDRLYEYGVYEERRIDAKFIYIKEVYVHAIDSKLPQSKGYALFEKVGNLLLEDNDLKADVRVKYLSEVALKTAASSVTNFSMFTRICNFFRTHGAEGEAELLEQTLKEYKK